jgi:hypothetical protein
MMSKKSEMTCVRNGVTYRTAPFDGRQAVERRLQNIIKLAVEIGQREGLIGNHKEGINELKGGKDVADKGNIRDCEIAEVREDKAGNQGGK